ncbi:MAG: hypothetical protein JNK33_04875 [Candidatus Doudnabacteria bacterium]|nr:hypothetical protein [Candidatus Doudnabacteria bacterium]
MSETTRKSFYIFLSTFLGVLLFLMLDRAAFLIAFIAGADITSLPVLALEYVTSMIAVAFGAWYGIWLGLVWYSAVYEEQTTKGVYGWMRGLRNSTARASQEGSWEIDDLVTVSSNDSKGREKLDYFEANTVKFAGGAPVATSRVQLAPELGTLKPRTVAKRAPRKTAARKTVS